MKSPFGLLILFCFFCTFGCSQKKNAFPVTEKPTTFKISLPSASCGSSGVAQFKSQSTLEAPSNLPLEFTGIVNGGDDVAPQAIMEICNGPVVVDSHYLNIDQENSFKIQSVALPKGSYQLKINFIEHSAKATLGLNID